MRLQNQYFDKFTATVAVRAHSHTHNRCTLSAPNLVELSESRSSHYSNFNLISDPVFKTANRRVAFVSLTHTHTLTYHHRQVYLLQWCAPNLIISSQAFHSHLSPKKQNNHKIKLRPNEGEIWRRRRRSDSAAATAAAHAEEDRR